MVVRQGRALLLATASSVVAISVQDTEVGVSQVTDHMNAHAWHDRAGSQREMTVQH